MIDETERIRTLGVPRVARAEFHPSIGSTNDRARELARAGCQAWTLVRAGVQTVGRGRSGRQWISPAGGLYLSIVLRPSLSGVGLLPLATGLAVQEALALWGVAGRLKWPNDVLAGERKIAGILAEATSGSAGLEWVVLGIGVNIRRVDASMEALASSIEQETGARPPGGDEVAGAIVGALVRWYDRLEGQESDSIVRAWSERSLAWDGRLIEGHCGTEIVRGLGRGIDQSGALLLEQPGGVIRRVFSGDVRMVRERDGGGGESCF